MVAKSKEIKRKISKRLLYSKFSINFAKNIKGYNSQTMKKNVISLSIITLMILMLGSCASSKKVAYFQNAVDGVVAQSEGLYDAKIMPKDILTITVSTTNPEAATPFNLTVSNTLNATGQMYSGSGVLQTYLVDNDGEIDYPVIGTIKVAGLTKNECQELVKSKIKTFLAEEENPIVTVRMSSYRVTIIGEVHRPGVIPVGTEKMSILEALASAGDLTIYGKRDNVMLIREEANGQKTIHRLNLNDADIISSPYYYLQQNDIVYVEPNSVQAKNSAIGSSTTIWFSLVSIMTSVASLLVNILRN